ncbi:hypothetical protein BBJ28_00000393 [Nothophytophthora sp. Chile5]|nr:hypothetical protein BBJ28_00000393 [Nothophytophthora sp. Chile5]
MSSQRVHNAALGGDAEDYYSFLPSDESMSDEEDAPPSPPPSGAKPDPVEELATAFASTSTSGSSVMSRAVFTPIGSLNGGDSPRQEPTKRRGDVKPPAPGVFSRGGGKELRLSPRSLQQHAARRSHLEEALDAAGRADAMDDGETTTATDGEAPFRFQQEWRVRNADEEMQASSASPAPTLERVEGHAPEKKRMGRRPPVATGIGGRSAGGDGDEEDDAIEPDPLYDEQLDAADEKWVQMNIRESCDDGVVEGRRVAMLMRCSGCVPHAGGDRAKGPETDATLCCPCCFVTVCMACERHATFTNQYRAAAAVNCRVKKDEILTYTSNGGSSVPASLPFHKRRNLASAAGSTTATATTGQQIARLLQADEFYPVACSDCGTMVGVFDRDQQYHFFNILPSNC